MIRFFSISIRKKENHQEKKLFTYYLQKLLLKFLIMILYIFIIFYLIYLKLDIHKIHKMLFYFSIIKKKRKNEISTIFSYIALYRHA